MKKTKYILLLMLYTFLIPTLVSATEYNEVSTKEDLINYVSLGENIKLTNDIDISEDGLIIPSESSVIIDLNGYTITVISEYNQNIRVSENATLTVMDSSSDKSGSIDSYGPLQGNGRGTIDVNGTFILNSGTINAMQDSQNIGYSINAIVVSKENSAAIYDEDYTAKVIINGGEVNAISTAITNHNSFGGNSQIIITGGIINSNQYAIYSVYTSGAIPAEHDITITGGVLSATYNTIYIQSSEFAYSDSTHNQNIVPDLYISDATLISGSGYSSVKFGLYNYDTVTTEDVLKYFDVTIENVKFTEYPEDLKPYFTSGWYILEELSDNYYEMQKVSLSTSGTTPENVDTPTVYIKNYDTVNQIIYNSISLDSEIVNLLSEMTTSISVTLESTTLDSVSQSLETAMQSLIVNGEILSYFNINILITIDDTEKYLESLNEEITLTIAIPEEYINTDSGITRTYYVLREHNGIVEKLDVTVNEEDTISFETDKFSVYALAYEDVENPETNDNIILFVSIALISLVAVAVVLKLKKD